MREIQPEPRRELRTALRRRTSLSQACAWIFVALTILFQSVAPISVAHRSDPNAHGLDAAGVACASDRGSASNDSPSDHGCPSSAPCCVLSHRAGASLPVSATAAPDLLSWPIIVARRLPLGFARPPGGMTAAGWSRLQSSRAPPVAI